MPWVDKGTRAVIQLYQRCRDRRNLPEEGGLFDQPETLMTTFDYIDAVIAEYRQKRAEETQREIAGQEALRKLGHG